MPSTVRDLAFPPVAHADRNGLLLIGGDLSRERLLEAYRSGIFPWPIVDAGVEILSWWSPDPRAIIELDRLYVSRRLRRRLRSGQFEVTFDRDFKGVIAGCAQPRKHDHGTWITPSLNRAYIDLHSTGYAHSVEAWHEGGLVGGVYGIALGGFFSGESMFHEIRDASKVALVHLVQHLRQRGFRLFDVQQWSPHLGRLGAIVIPRREFLARLQEAIHLPVSFCGETEIASFDQSSPPRRP